MTTELVYSPALAAYRLSAEHPLRPERVILAVELARSWALLGEAGEAGSGRAAVVEPATVSDEDIARVHTAEYVRAVRMAGGAPNRWRGGFGIGPGDTPAFPDMHEASAAIAGATSRALEDVLGGSCRRSFSPAGGLHHAHADHASGFCVYNDLAIAIAKVTTENPGLRIAYIDIDAHHGDGVQAAFWERPDVLTISIHESGRYLFPGTGRTVEIGAGPGTGYAVNLPLAPGAGDDAFAAAFARVIAPAVRAFAPDAILAQLGADSHRADPLTHLDVTVAGHHAMVESIRDLAEQTCSGRLAATGGGGYDTFSAVPRAWACALAALLDVEPPSELPAAWRVMAIEAAERAGVDVQPGGGTFDELPAPTDAVWGDPFAETMRTIEQLRADHPLLRT